MTQLAAPAERVEIHAAEHRFDVDGEPFPWYIDAAGPEVVQLRPDLWSVGVTIMVSSLSVPPTQCTFTCAAGHPPVIADQSGEPREFPWAISDEGLVYTRSRTDVPTVRLGFLARSLFSHDVPVTSLGRSGLPEVWDMDGQLWALPVE